MGAALADRFVHVKIIPNPQDWIAWAMENDIHASVITFIKVKPEYLAAGGPVPGEQLITPSPRSWERVSRVLQATSSKSAVSLAVNGLVGEAVAVQFFHVVEEVGQLPPIDELMEMAPEAAAKLVPASITALYGLAYSLVSYASTLPQIEQVMAILEAVSSVRDPLPRREIQTLGMELLLAKAHRLRLMDTFVRSDAYQGLYRQRAREIAR
jgi:hypothetical protein